MAGGQRVFIIALIISLEGYALRQVEFHLVARERRLGIAQVHHNRLIPINRLHGCVQDNAPVYRRGVNRQVEGHVRGFMQLGARVRKENLLETALHRSAHRRCNVDGKPEQLALRAVDYFLARREAHQQIATVIGVTDGHGVILLVAARQRVFIVALIISLKGYALRQVERHLIARECRLGIT